MDICRSCGACCSYSPDWPIFTTDDEADLDLIPARFVAHDLRGMACTGDRCSALVGQVGRSAACSIYGLRPDVCRSCQLGDEACSIARRRFALPALSSGSEG